MSVVGLLVQCGLKYAFDFSSKELLKWVDARFTDSSGQLPRALVTANQRAWQVVGLALADGTFASRLGATFRDGDLKAARDAIRALIERMPNGLGVPAVQLRRRAAVELAEFRSRTSLAGDAVMAAGADSLRRFSDPASLLEDSLQAAAMVPDEVAPQAQHLAAVLRLAPDGTPLFDAMFRHFLRVAISRDEELSRRLTHDQLAAVAGILDTRTAGILDQLDVLFDEFAVLNRKLDSGIAGVGAANEKLDHIVSRLLRPGVTYATEDERAFLLSQKEEFRRNAGGQTSAAWARLAGAMSKARLPAEAEDAHETAARIAHAERDTVTEGANHYEAYLDACEAGRWSRAFELLWRAVGIDPARYRPFDNRRYRPERILGGGAFGTVFLCHDDYDRDDDDNPRPVAIKSFRGDALDRDLAKVFAEARTLRALGHPSIIGVIDQGFGDPDSRDRPFLVLEYFAGRTLDQHVAEFGPLPLPDFLSVARPVAEALHAAHTRPRPIFHRDLKPSNVMVLRHDDGTWTVKVIDFGLAVRAEVARAGLSVPEANRSTREKSVTGTIKYAPPEQLGELRGVEVGPYSDVFAFGKTCLDVLFRTTAPKSWDWAELPGDARGPMQELLERCTADPLEHRYRNFEPVLAALTGFGLVKRKKECGPGTPLQEPSSDSPSTPPNPLSSIAATPELRPLPQSTPTEWNITIPGVWYSRPAANPQGAWVEVTRTRSGDVAARKKIAKGRAGKVNYSVVTHPAEEYKLEVHRLATDADLEGLKPLRALTNLTTLDLSGCRLVTDAGLVHVGTLTNLAELSLQGCDHVTDAGLAQLRALADLTALRLERCAQITDAGLGCIGELSNLGAFDLVRCGSITDVGLAVLRKLKKLRVLRIVGRKQLTSAVLSHVADLTDLTSLRVEGVLVRDSGLGFLKGLTSLVRLELLECERVTDAGLAFLLSLSNLRTLKLGGRKVVSDRGLADLSFLSNLTELNLGGCGLITDAGLAYLSKLTGLATLVLGDRYMTARLLGDRKEVSDTGLAQLRLLVNLTSLELGWCERVTDAGLAHLSVLSNLSVLHLVGPQLSAVGWAELQKALPTCRINE